MNSLRCCVEKYLDRIAARYVQVPPFVMGTCSLCNGDGIYFERTFSIKSTCIKCLGTGVDRKSLEELGVEVANLSTKYEREWKEFQKDKDYSKGKSMPSFGITKGKNLQTLRIFLTNRQEQLKKEEQKRQTAVQLAKVVGAAAKF